MSEVVTKQDLTDGLTRFGLDIKADTKDQIDSLRSAMNTKFDEMKISFGSLEDDMSKVKDAVLSTDMSMHNLIAELENHGIAVDRAKVFAI